MKKIKGILLSAALSIGALGLSASPAEAGGSCSPTTYSRSGSYVTYSAYATGAWYQVHRVRVYKDGVWTDGPTIWGNGWSRVTLYHPDRTGVAICQVLS